jgi:hypothetical protein
MAAAPRPLRPVVLQHRPGFNISLDTNGVAIPLNQWNHVALTRSSNTLRLFLNGSQRGAVTFADTMIGVPVVTERFSGPGNLGHIDLVQMVTGQSVYTANFTPSAEFYTL